MTIRSELLHQAVRDDIEGHGLSYTDKFWPDMSHQQAFASSLVGSLTKKYVEDVSDDADAKALAKFLHCNDACKEWEPNTNIGSKLETLLGTVRQSLYHFWFPGNGGCPDPLIRNSVEIFSQSQTGPGSSRGAHSNSFYAKLFASRLSVSSTRVYDEYTHYISRVADWAAAEKHRVETHGDSYIANSRLSFVAKNDDISRCICTEPTLNGFAQLGIGNILESRLKVRYGIGLDDQQFKNRDLARLGSITDNLSTIDLSSASDTISLRMLKYLLPDSFYRVLEKYRTPFVEIGGVGTVELHMVSTMGNGFTFPLQTILFSSIVTASLRFRGLPLNRRDSQSLWGVFGDDIICPRACTQDVLDLLDFLGFRVNSDKTFVEGPFRESCGSDFYCGVNVRGVYIKDTSSPQALYSAINNLVRFSTRSAIPFYRTVDLLMANLKPRDRLFVPRLEDMSSGIHAPSSLDEVRKYPRAQDIQGKFYRCYVAKASTISILEDRFMRSRHSKGLAHNPPGLFVSFLQGCIRDSRIMVRENQPYWSLKRRASSRWDSVSHYNDEPVSKRDHDDYGLDWQRWETVALCYFTSM